MSFRKRNSVITSAAPSSHQSQTTAAKHETQICPGLRPSPLDGRLTTSTGTSSLDQLLAGHTGLPMGTCLLVEEQGTTDFSGTLLRYYAAEGLVQGHQVYAVGLPPMWQHELPAVAAPDPKRDPVVESGPLDNDLKIAWRYKALGNSAGPKPSTQKCEKTVPFCHSFDLAKRLAVGSYPGSFQAVALGPALSPPSSSSPLKSVIKHLQASLSTSSPTTVHRLVVPSLLLPSIYPPECCNPREALQFLHAVRALLRQYSKQFTALMTLPVTLFPRSLGLIRWMELLCDGVIELIPLPADPAAGPPGWIKRKGGRDEQSQGMLRVHSLPVYHEKGGGRGRDDVLQGEFVIQPQCLKRTDH